MKKISITYDRLKSIVEESIKKNFVKEGNAGNAFEADLAKRLSNVSNGNYSDKQAYDLMKTIVKAPETTIVKHEGGLNQKRIIISQDGSIVGPGDIGQTVTDITIDTNSGSKYLSVKYGNTLKISNIGISNWFKDGNESCAKFFASILSNPKDAKNVATSFIGWFKSNEKSKMEVLAKVYENCCKKSRMSVGNIDDFVKKCVSWAKSTKKTNEIDALFEDFIMAVDKNGRRNDQSRSMVATWLAVLSKDQYKNIYGRAPHNFQKHTAKFEQELNAFGYPMMEGENGNGESNNFEDYLFNRKHPVDESGLKRFIATCVGYGYWMVHGNANGTIDAFEMDKRQCKQIADSVNCNNLKFINSGKGLNINIECGKIANLQFQFRSAHAGIIPDEFLISYGGYQDISRAREF